MLVVPALDEPEHKAHSKRDGKQQSDSAEKADGDPAKEGAAPRAANTTDYLRFGIPRAGNDGYEDADVAVTLNELLMVIAMQRGTFGMNITRWRWLAATRFVALVIMIGVTLTSGASADTLGRMRQTNTIRIAYRDDALPFSYKDKAGEPAGYMVDLCRAVAKKLAQQLSLPSLSVVYLKVTASDRFDAITQEKADLLCEPTTATLSRRELVDFSIATFVDGASLISRPDGPHDLRALAGRKIGVPAGTTTEQALRKSLSNAGITADIIMAKTHAEGLAMLDEARISAYFADRSILASLIQESKAPDDLTLAETYLTIEPYALALPRGDGAFRLEVDRALSHIFGSDEIVQIFKHIFSEKAQPSQMLQTLYVISALPD